MAWQTNGYFLKNTGINDEHKFYSIGMSVYDYFNSCEKVGSFDEYSYIRAENETFSAYQPAKCHADLPYHECLEIDYVMFQNKNFNDKWFYGRVLQHEYVNPKSTRLWFEIDWFSTFIEDCTLKECFVKREHLQTDNEWSGDMPFGRNFEPEPFSINRQYELVIIGNRAQDDKNARDYTPDNSNMVLYASTDPTGEPITEYNVEHERHLLCFSSAGFDALEMLKAFIDNEHAENIFSICNVPSQYLPLNVSKRFSRYTFLNRANAMNVFGYRVKNAKCFSYPFMYHKFVGGGSSILVRQEEFNTPQVEVEFDLIGGPDGGVSAKVNFYATGYEHPPMPNTITVTGFPQSAYGTDAYKNWWSTNKGQVIGSIVGGVAQMAIGIGGIMATPATGGFTAGAGAILIAGGANQSLQAVASISDNNSQDSLAHGSQSGAASIINNTWKFELVTYTLQQEGIISLDNFFECYGYATNRLKVPNVSSRPFWNFVKTDNCCLKGKAPSYAIDLIKATFNKGVTLWHTPDIGNYNQDNH